MNNCRKPSKRENKQIVVRYLIGAVVEYILCISAMIFVGLHILKGISYILEWMCNHTPTWTIISAPAMIIIIAMVFLIFDGSVERES